jgi:hypothetical protein
MNEARIEIRTRDVKGVPYVPTQGDAQHLFIIYTDSQGKETILRGGPETGSSIAMFKDNLKIV